MKRVSALRLLITAAFVAAPIWIALPVRAAPLGFKINTTTDDPDAHIGDGWCKTSTGQCSLRAAIQETNAIGAGASTITLPSGTYTLTMGGSGEDWAATGDLDIRVNMTLMGTVGSTTVVGGPGFGDRIFDIPSGVSPNFTLNGVNVKGGAAPAGEDGGGVRVQGGSLKAISVTISANTTGGSGGGLYQNAGTLNLSYSTLSGNSAGSHGGGLDLEGSATTTNFNHVTVSDNTAFQGGGLAAFVTPGATGSIPLIFNATISGNSTTGGAGGGMAVTRTTALKLTVTGNTAPYGGGVELLGSSLPAFLASRITISGNTATVSGGGIYTANCAPSCGSLLQVTLESNVANQDGSGMYVNGGLSMQDVTINANRTQGQGAYGGAVYHAGSADGPMIMTNMTVGENTDGPVAGGIVEDSSATDVITNLTIGNNTGGTANGIVVTPSATPPQLHNTIVSSAGVNCTRPVASLGYNLDSGNTCGLNKPGDLVNTDPLLHPVADNGGGTHTMKPGEGISPVFDAGDPNFCPVTDQRSARRPVDYDGNGTAVCDIGSYEGGVSSLNADIGFSSVTASVSGSTVTYTMNMKNTGEGAGINSIVTDVLPASLSYVSCSATLGGVCGGTGNNRTVTFANIAIGATPKVTLVATILGSGKIDDAVIVWSENTDWFPWDNTKAMSIQV